MSRDWISHQPAIDFEDTHGVSGIAGHYKFPKEPGSDRLSMQHRIWEHYDTAANGPAQLKSFSEAIRRPA